MEYQAGDMSSACSISRNRQVSCLEKAANAYSLVIACISYKQSLKCLPYLTCHVAIGADWHPLATLDGATQGLSVKARTKDNPVRVHGAEMIESYWRGLYGTVKVLVGSRPVILSLYMPIDTYVLPQLGNNSCGVESNSIFFKIWLR